MGAMTTHFITFKSVPNTPLKPAPSRGVDIATGLVGHECSSFYSDALSISTSLDELEGISFTAAVSALRMFFFLCALDLLPL